MSTQRTIYALLKYANDLKAVRRAARTGTLAPIGRRVGRRVYGKASGRLARKLFG